ANTVYSFHLSGFSSSPKLSLPLRPGGHIIIYWFFLCLSWRSFFSHDRCTGRLPPRMPADSPHCFFFSRQLVCSWLTFIIRCGIFRGCEQIRSTIRAGLPPSILFLATSTSMASRHRV